MEPGEEADEVPPGLPTAAGRSGSVDFQLTAADVGAVARGDPRRRVPLLAGLCTLLLLLNLASGEGASSVVLPVTVAAVYVAYFWWWLPRRAWSRAVSFRRPQTVSWNAKGLAISIDGSTSRVNWGTVARVRDVGKLATLHPAGRTVLAIVPARAFASDEDYRAFVRFARDQCRAAGRPKGR